MGQTGDAREDGRTRNGRATRERVYEAAIKVFVSRGFDSATMDEIAAQAGVARRTAFNHFPAKTDIAAEWAVRRGEMAFALVRTADRSDGSAADRVRAYFHELALMTERDWDETRQMTTGWLRGYGVPHHRSWLAGELRDWVRDWLQEPPSDGFTEGLPDPALATDVLYDVFQGALLRRLPQPKLAHGEFSTEADAAIGLVLAGMAGMAGKAAGRTRPRSGR
ncbi:TetR/AcrR family transcriptional regulator [Streptomyces sp. NPDC088350]|uniref:TetR/AcrR family transcriptional regulator n=1 Tax=Streptomyces sp. NPDC088350 TaxID=3365854 RepID=UPI0037FB3445